MAVLVGSLFALSGPTWATPLACGDPCIIESHSIGYIAPSLEIASGGTVIWTSLDTPAHLHRDSAVMGPDDPCYVVVSTSIEDSDPVRFDIVDGQLIASQPDGNGGEISAVCRSAVALPGGAAFLLKYHCGLHSQMHGALVVTAV